MQKQYRRRRRIVIVVQSFLLVGMLSLYFTLIPIRASHPLVTALGIFYTSAKLLWQREDIYSAVSWDMFGALPDSLDGIQYEPVRPNLNLPHVTVLLAPLAWLDYTTAYWFWSVLSLVAGFTACFLIWHTAAPQPRKGVNDLIWVWIIFLAYYPTFTALQLGQLTFILLLPVALVWSLSRSASHLWLAGILLGLVVSLKIFAGALVLFFLVRRQWQVVISACISFFAALLLGLFVVNVEGYQSYLAAMQMVTWYGNNWNASFTSFFTRIFGGTENVPWIDAPWLANLLSYICSLVSIVWVGILAWPKELNEEDNIAHFDLAFGLMLAVMLLASPLGWMYYFPLLLIPGISAWYITRDRIPRRYRWGIVLAWMLSNTPLLMVQPRDINAPLAWISWAAVYFYALLVAIGVLSAMILYLRHQCCVPHMGKARPL